MEDQKRSFDGEVIHQLARLRTSWVCQIASRTGPTHFSDICVHPWPEKPQSDPMQGTCRVEMPAEGVAVEGNENDVSQVNRDELKLGI